MSMCEYAVVLLCQISTLSKVELAMYMSNRREQGAHTHNPSDYDNIDATTIYCSSPTAGKFNQYASEITVQRSIASNFTKKDFHEIELKSNII